VEERGPGKSHYRYMDPADRRKVLQPRGRGERDTSSDRLRVDPQRHRRTYDPALLRGSQRREDGSILFEEEESPSNGIEKEWYRQ